MTNPLKHLQAAKSATVPAKPKIPNTNIMQPKPRPNFDNSDIGYSYPKKIWEPGFVGVPWFPAPR